MELVAGDYLSVGESEAMESSLCLVLLVDNDLSLRFRLRHLNLVRPRALLSQVLFLRR